MCVLALLCIYVGLTSLGELLPCLGFSLIAMRSQRPGKLLKLCCFVLRYLLAPGLILCQIPQQNCSICQMLLLRVLERDMINQKGSICVSVPIRALKLNLQHIRMVNSQDIVAIKTNELGSICLF